MIPDFDMKLNSKFAHKYLISSKKYRSKIIDDYCSLTGVSRNLASKRLCASGKNIFPVAIKIVKPNQNKGPKRKYLSSHTKLVHKIWILSGKICAERIHPIIDVYLDQLKHNIELNEFSTEVVFLCRNISLITLKRIVSTFPKSSGKRRFANPSIYKSIPIDMHFNSYSSQPGFVQIDPVEHCGNSASGTFAITGSYVDLYSQWICRSASLGMSFKSMCAIHELNKTRIYHPVLKWHSDNAKAILKLLLVRVVGIENLLDSNLPEFNDLSQISRSRPYQKQDNGYVEQKNDDKVRKIVGYHRYDTEDQVNILNRLYLIEDLITNFFTPSHKLIGKTYFDNGRYKKIYDDPKTPYQRLMRCKTLDKSVKVQLKGIYDSLNLVLLRKESDKLKKDLIKSILRKNNMIEPTVEKGHFEEKEL